MNEKYTQVKDVDREQFRQVKQEIFLQIVAKGGGIEEAIEALSAIGVTGQAVMEVVLPLMDQNLVIQNNKYRFELTGTGEAYLLEKQGLSEDVEALAGTIVESKARMRSLGQRLLESVKDSY